VVCNPLQNKPSGGAVAGYQEHKEKNMPIPKKKVAISLEKVAPTEVTPEELQKELRENMGLKCEYTEIDALEQLKADVLSRWGPTGKGQAYGIYLKNPGSVQQSARITHLNVKDTDLLQHFGFSNEGVNGEWEPDDTAQGYRNELFTIQFPANFHYLETNFGNEFAGIFNHKEDVREVGTVDAISDFFVQIGQELAGLTVKGIAQKSLEPILKNALAVNESSLKIDYQEGSADNPKTRIIFLVENYDEKTEMADAIGVLAIDWYLFIENYKEKKGGAKHTAKLVMDSRSVLYSDLHFLYRDYTHVASHRKSLLFAEAGVIPPRQEKLKVFDFKPAACYETFLHGLPVMPDSSDYLDTIILHHGDIQLLYAMDNTESKASSTFEKSITEGFTFAAQQTLSAELSFEVGCDIVKTGFKMSLSVSFTQQWNKTVTETVSYTVPAGEIAFAYQAYINTSLLRYTPADNSYRYVEHAKFLTSSLKTLEKPLNI
jgi:hypothetical protein